MRTEELAPDQLELGSQGRRWTLYAVATAVVGSLATAALVLTSEHGFERFFHSYLVNFTFFLSLGIGALFFVLVTHLTRAGWSVALRRIAEVVSMTLLPLFFLSLVVYWGRHELYEWTNVQAVAADELLQHKQAYLNAPFFLGRIVAYFVIWVALAWYFSRSSSGQDESGDVGATLRMERVAAPGMILFALTVTFASFDFLMSLYPHWYSTIYGVYYFSGAVLGMFALVTLMVSLLQGAGKLSHVVTTEHYHDLGKLMFAFVVFWAYIAFSQYMLIWVAAIPEETEWYLVRQEGPWLVLSLALLVGHFFVPFLWLISRHSKRRMTVLLSAAVWVLLMHWFDLFWLVIPETRPHEFPFHLLDLTCLLGLGGIFFASVFWRLSRVNLVAKRDPRLEESMRLENV